jgi:hypothetical protein
MRQKIRHSHSQKIVLDQITADKLQILVNASSVEEFVQKVDIDVDAFAAFLQASGQQNLPEARTIMDALLKKKNSAGPEKPQP